MTHIPYTNYNDWLSTLSERDFHAHVAGRLDAPSGLGPSGPSTITEKFLAILCLGLCMVVMG
jgi:hypothetical protein